ncbi:hypothetical protein ACFLY9_02535, partial [Patescibacteria group bacterium]
NIRLLNKLKQLFGGTLIERKLQKRKSRSGETLDMKKVQYQWNIQGVNAINFLVAIRPYLWIMGGRVDEFLQD